ncbi:hypothetical protein N7535_001636 [Penicillium sp. DV-2018c]|nr:hypothetical protein N7461_005120 [Penicillium sp. DV-2018c]KAJ5583016.1 hypothetical protein N7535_001636 [Penicillium sp. DV-2018c]
MDRFRPGNANSPIIVEYDFSHPDFGDCFDPFASRMHTPAFPPGAYPPQYAPYEVDVRTERQTFVNDVPLRHDSSVSTFSAMGPPQLHNTLPTFHADDWLQEDCFRQAEPSHFDPTIISHSYEASLPYFQTATIPVEDSDRPLLEHFVEHVLRMIFPIPEAHQQGEAQAKIILSALETNKSYLHCCLSVSATHLKTTVGLEDEQIDHDIMRHRYQAVSKLCESLSLDTDHEGILDATLAMIFFHCSVGSPDDSLPDIPWSDHFQAVSSLVSRLELSATTMPQPKPHAISPFSMSLITWIDILGATMLGKAPQFAHTYRSKHLTGTSTGLRELMGCDDRIMYLISEIACLDSLKTEGRIDEVTVCHHVSALGAQLEYTETAEYVLDQPYTADGVFQPEQLIRNLSTIFRLAARIYLCSLVPGFKRTQQSVVTLVSAITNALQYIPAGPFGFDRSLVWPLLMAASFSTPESSFRQVLVERAAALGDISDFGAFGRMYRLVQEVWRLSIDPEESCESQDPAMGQEVLSSPTSGLSCGPANARYIKKQSVHWRDIMNRNGWRYLLM